MGRTKDFDEESAVAAAATLFWRRGYANTSVAQLLAAMDILNGSFYHSFGGKSGLYLRALEKYNESVTDSRLGAWEKADGLSAGIRAFFAEVFRGLRSRKTPDGCMMTNSMQPDVLADAELRAYIHDGVKSFTAVFVARFDEAKAASELPATFDSDTTAGVLVTFLQGLFRVSNLGKNLKRLERQTELLLASLGL